MTTTVRQPSAGVSRNTTLRDEFRFFRRQTQPRIEAAAVLVAVVARLAGGPWAGGDAVIAVVLVAIQPFFEWVFHVYVLHHRPVQVLGRTIDFELARQHREHHVDPTVTELVFVPVRSLLWALAVVVALSLVFLPSVATALTMIVGVCTLLLAYEWTHYLIHSQYRPQTRMFRAIWRAHRLHHYKNEQYWFGVTNPTADIVLRTYPEPASVATSPTARSLGISE